MPYSEMFADSAQRRARILEQVAERYRRIRLEEFAALKLLARTRGAGGKRGKPARTGNPPCPPPTGVKGRAKNPPARLKQAAPAPEAKKEQPDPATIRTYRRSRTGRVKIVAELDAETAEV